MPLWPGGCHDRRAGGAGRARACSHSVVLRRRWPGAGVRPAHIRLTSAGRRPTACILQLHAGTDRFARFSGAEIEQAAISAAFDAFAERRPVTEDDLKRSITNTVPLSVTQAESIARIRAWAENRAVAATGTEDRGSYSQSPTSPDVRIAADGEIRLAGFLTRPELRRLTPPPPPTNAPAADRTGGGHCAEAPEPCRPPLG